MGGLRLLGCLVNSLDSRSAGKQESGIRSQQSRSQTRPINPWSHRLGSRLAPVTGLLGGSVCRFTAVPCNCSKTERNEAVACIRELGDKGRLNDLDIASRL